MAFNPLSRPAFGSMTAMKPSTTPQARLSKPNQLPVMFGISALEAFKVRPAAVNVRLQPVYSDFFTFKDFRLKNKEDVQNVRSGPHLGGSVTFEYQGKEYTVTFNNGINDDTRTRTLECPDDRGILSIASFDQKGDDLGVFHRYRDEEPPAGARQHVDDKSTSIEYKLTSKLFNNLYNFFTTHYPKLLGPEVATQRYEYYKQTIEKFNFINPLYWGTPVKNIEFENGKQITFTLKKVPYRISGMNPDKTIEDNLKEKSFVLENLDRPMTLTYGLDEDGREQVTYQKEGKTVTFQKTGLWAILLSINEGKGNTFFKFNDMDPNAIFQDVTELFRGLYRELYGMSLKDGFSLCRQGVLTVSNALKFAYRHLTCPSS